MHRLRHRRDLIVSHARCDNCQFSCDETQLNDVRDHSLRVDTDGPEPAGECPRCGALAYTD
ncbi:DNA polymerase III polC-type [Mycolicibacterium canariasense]|uniref:DNA polymerase III polC-type n=1 Tax=Mycolicibacterium canariasense TaxID=228230 RepID=A0A124E1W2_MYCCR|nr:DNA polymerase III polC-type [Mycolicibacterium canariasense]